MVDDSLGKGTSYWIMLPSKTPRYDNPAELTPARVRDRLLEAAGITPAVQAQIVRRAVGTLSRKLRAKKTHIVSHMGAVTAQIELEDNMAQIAAARELAMLMGVQPSKDVNNQSVKVEVEVKLPDWGKPPEPITIEATIVDEQKGISETAVITPP